MYKTPAAYNAFVWYKKTLGTELEVHLGGAEGGMIVGSADGDGGAPCYSRTRGNAGRAWDQDFLFIFSRSWFQNLGFTNEARWEILEVGVSNFFLYGILCGAVVPYSMLDGVSPSAQRWPMGFAGSVRLGWKEARCMACGSVITPDAFSSSLRRRHAAFGFRFLSVGFSSEWCGYDLLF